MTKLAASIRAKLLNVSKLDKVAFQDLINRFGAEQFLARLSQSFHAQKFIFKGGALLTYLIETERKTRDLDFSMRHISNQIEGTTKIIQEILDIAIDDALVWKKPEGEILNHLAMEYPGLRIRCKFTLGSALGQLQMDLAIGDQVNARKIPLERIRYKNVPLMGPDFEILVYPPETIFSEKLQTCFSKKGQNTRMKDYYDLFKLCGSDVIRDAILVESIKATFTQRQTEIFARLEFAPEDLKRLQDYWAAFLRKMKIADAPKDIVDVMSVVNKKLKVIQITAQ